MSLLEKSVELIREKGYPKLEDGAERGLEKGLEKAREFLGSDRALEWGAEPVRAAALEGLGKVEAIAPSLAHLAADEVKGLLEATFRGLGSAETTRNDYFRMSFQERREAKWAITDELAAETERREQAWEEFQELLEELGQLALRTLIPLVLAAL